MSLREALIAAIRDRAVEKLRGRGRRALLSARAALQSDQVDPTPMELSEEFQRPVSLKEQIQAYIRTEMSRAAVESGHGSFDEEDDFEVVDEDEVKLSAHDVRMLVPETDESLDGGPVPPSPPAKAEESR